MIKRWTLALLLSLFFSGCMTFGMGPARRHDMLPSKTLSISIQSTPAKVYEFVSNAENLPVWATTFVRSIRQVKGEWVIETAQGPAKIRIAPKNESGILDHTIQTAAGDEVFVPMRVVPNGDGSEVLFTLFHMPGMTDEAFAADATMVEQDLQTLKKLMEQLQ